MLSRRPIVILLMLIARLLARSAEANGAFDRYNARLDEIARSYKEQFAEIRKNQTSELGSAKTAERQLKELGLRRSAAIAEARLLYQKEQKEDDLPAAPNVSFEQRQREFLAGQRLLFEDGQKALWDRLARDEPKNAALWAARMQTVEQGQKAFWDKVAQNEPRAAHLWAQRIKSVEEAQNAFWADVLDAPKSVSQGGPPMVATSRVQSASTEETANP